MWREPGDRVECGWSRSGGHEGRLASQGRNKTQRNLEIRMLCLVSPGIVLLL